MQFAKRYQFEVSFKVAKLHGDSVSRNLSPESAVACHLKLRPSSSAHQQQASGSCEVHLVCKCGDRVSFAYVEAQLAGCCISWDQNTQQCAGGLVLRFDSATSERLLGLVPLPTIGRNSRFVAANLRLSGQLLVEDGCGPDAFAPDGISDVRLRVEGRELHLHRSLLAKTSPVFRAMLLGEFREGSPDAAAIELPGKTLSHFLELLATVYPPQLEMHSGRAKTLLPLLTEYQMDHLTQRCERALLQSPMYETCSGGGVVGGGGAGGGVLVAGADVGLKLPQPWMDELLDHVCLATVYQLKELQEKSVALLASVQTSGCQEALKDLLPDEVLCRIFAQRVSILEGKIGRLNEELEGYRSKLQASVDSAA